MVIIEISAGSVYVFRNKKIVFLRTGISGVAAAASSLWPMSSVPSVVRIVLSPRADHADILCASHQGHRDVRNTRRWWWWGGV